MNMDETQAEILLTNKVNITEGDDCYLFIIFAFFSTFMWDDDVKIIVSSVFLSNFAFQFWMVTLKADKKDKSF